MRAESGFRNIVAGLGGALGASFAALCCIGFSVLVGILGAVGATFLLQDRILIPLLAVSLLITLIGLIGTFRRRREKTPFILGILGIGITFISVLMIFKAGVYGGVVLLLGTTFWNLASGIQSYRHERKLA